MCEIHYVMFSAPDMLIVLPQSQRWFTDGVQCCDGLRCMGEVEIYQPSTLSGDVGAAGRYRPQEMHVGRTVDELVPYGGGRS